MKAVDERSTEAISQKLIQLEKRLKQQEQEIACLQAHNDIEAFIGKFATMFNQKNMAKIADFFALDEPDVSIEPSDAGVLIGAEKVRELYEKTFFIPDIRGNMLRHNFTNQVIEVAKDCKTAKGLWWSVGYQSVKHGDDGLRPVWCFSNWAFDFIRKPEGWKIWHLHCYQVVKCDAQKLWTNDYKDWTSHLQPDVNACNNAMIEKKLREHLETTYFNPWTPEAIQEAIPACPEPYDTWKDGEEDWIFANEPDMKGYIAVVK